MTPRGVNVGRSRRTAAQWAKDRARRGHFVRLLNTLSREPVRSAHAGRKNFRGRFVAYQTMFIVEVPGVGR